MKKQQRPAPGPMSFENTARADFINRFMGAPGQPVPGNPGNFDSANPVPSQFAMPNDISSNQRILRNPYGDVTFAEDGNDLLNVVIPTWPAARIMAGNPAKGYDQQPNIGFPASNTKNIDAAMQQNVPPPQNTAPVPVSPEARGMSTSVTSAGSGPQRNVPPPQQA